jgi:hypothetical protein
MLFRSFETWYHGVKFRSRLEAAWARWFDGHRVAWEYEPEGYQLPDGTGYLPDFWLPELDTIIEVKGVLQRADEAKMKLFAADVAETGALFLLVGPAGQQWCGYGPSGMISGPAVEFLPCAACERWNFAYLEGESWICRLCATIQTTKNVTVHPHYHCLRPTFVCTDCLHLPPWK